LQRNPGFPGSYGAVETGVRLGSETRKKKEHADVWVPIASETEREERRGVLRAALWAASWAEREKRGPGGGSAAGGALGRKLG